MKIKTNPDYLLGVVEPEVGSRIEELLRVETEEALKLGGNDSDVAVRAIISTAQKLKKPYEMNALFFVLGAYFQKTVFNRQMSEILAEKPKVSA